jgi:hypothetical protein
VTASVPIELSEAAGTNPVDTSGPPDSGPSGATARLVNLGDNSAGLSGPPGDHGTSESAEIEPIEPATDREGLNPTEGAEGPATASPTRAIPRDSSRSKKSPRTK